MLKWNFKSITEAEQFLAKLESVPANWTKGGATRRRHIRSLKQWIEKRKIAEYREAQWKQGQDQLRSEA